METIISSSYFQLLLSGHSARQIPISLVESNSKVRPFLVLCPNAVRTYSSRRRIDIHNSSNNCYFYMLVSKCYYSQMLFNGFSSGIIHRLLHFRNYRDITENHIMLNQKTHSVNFYEIFLKYSTVSTWKQHVVHKIQKILKTYICLLFRILGLTRLYQ